MTFVVVLLVLAVIVGVVALTQLPRGRRTRYTTVEDRAPGRD